VCISQCIFWYVLLYTWMDRYQCFGGTCCLHLQATSYAKDGRSWFLWNDDTYLQNYMESHSRRPEFKQLQLWEPQISHFVNTFRAGVLTEANSVARLLHDCCLHCLHFFNFMI
jgi:hypothetical protein